MFCRSFCFVKAVAVEMCAGADAIATGLSGLTRLGGGATGMVAVPTVDTCGLDSALSFVLSFTVSILKGRLQQAKITH